MANQEKIQSQKIKNYVLNLNWASDEETYKK